MGMGDIILDFIVVLQTLWHMWVCQNLISVEPHGLCLIQIWTKQIFQSYPFCAFIDAKAIIDEGN